MFSIKRWRKANPNYNPQTEKRIDTVLKTIIAFLVAYGCVAIGYAGYACLEMKQNLDKEVTESLNESNESTDDQNRLKMSISIIFLLVILMLCMFMK